MSGQPKNSSLLKHLQLTSLRCEPSTRLQFYCAMARSIFDSLDLEIWLIPHLYPMVYDVSHGNSEAGPFLTAQKRNMYRVSSIEVPSE